MDADTMRGKGRPRWMWVPFTAVFLRVFVRILGLTGPAWGVLFAVIVALGAVFARVEGLRFATALYFALITAMTIGYGDISPTTHFGKVLSITIGILGTITTGIIVAAAIHAVKVAYETTVLRGEPKGQGGLPLSQG